MAGGRVTGLHDPYTGALVARRFKVLEKVGEGGMGIVYLARDQNTGFRVAIKILHDHFVSRPDVAERFRNEVTAAAMIDHPNIARIIDCGQVNEGGALFIVSEFLSGETLANVIGQPPKPLHPQRIRKIGLQVLSVLAAAHAAGVVHRDLKPENIFVLRHGRDYDFVKVIDLGIAKITTNGNGGSKARLTQPGTVFGTPLYMSPEQCCGGQVDHRADIYSLGVILYEMVTGQTPFPERDKAGNPRSQPEVMTDHIATLPVPPNEFNREVSPLLAEMILKALAKKPDNRFESADAFAEALEQAIPFDQDFYRSSQRVPTLPPQEADGPTHRVATGDFVALSDSFLPSSGARLVKGSDISQTPTRLLPQTRKSTEDIGKAKTITPTDLRLEQAAAKVAESATQAVTTANTPRAAAIPAAKNRDKVKEAITLLHNQTIRLCHWITVLPRYMRLMVLAGATAGLLAVIAIPLFSSDNSSPQERAEQVAVAPDAKIDVSAAEVWPEVATRQRERDVVILHVPFPVPAPDAEAEETKTAEATPKEITEPEEAAAEPPAMATDASTSATPPAGYREFLEAARRARSPRLAIGKLEEATRLWPEGPDAWEALGDVLVLVNPNRAKEAYSRCLELLPLNNDLRRRTLQGKLQGLE